MESLKELYKIGYGPSSSHTMGPAKACEYINNKYKEATSFVVTLYGSLAFTGKGHLTDYIINKTLNKPSQIIFDYLTTPFHPNTMEFVAKKNDQEIGKDIIYSIGGGSIKINNEELLKPLSYYPFTSFATIKEYCLTNKISLPELVYKFDTKDIKDYLSKIYDIMVSAIKEGLNSDGFLPGKLHIKRKAHFLLTPKDNTETDKVEELRVVCSYAYAVSEQNACGKQIVTAPTCGSSGVLPAILYYFQEKEKVNEKEIINALAVAGIIGNVVKTNASISGAEAGCQSEIGTACSMAAAASAYLMHLDIEQIEYAAEIALEHHLGLTCDPISGLVQIPCIERNAVAALRAIDSARLSSFLSDSRKVSFDTVVDTMYQTGKDIQASYRETSAGGLAKYYKEKKEN